jgi:hypothetical protein
LSDFRNIMRRNWETLDLEKIQDHWYERVTLRSDPSADRMVSLGAAGTNLGSSANAGRSFSKTSVTSLRRGLILQG